MKMLFVALTLLSATAFASGWNHVNMIATDGSQIAVDYTLTVPTGGALGNGALWFNVRPVNVTANANVKVLIMNIEETSAGPKIIEQYIADLYFNSSQGKYTGQIMPSLGDGYRHLRSNLYGKRQEIAVVVNGNWLKNPKTSQSNFSFQMSLCHQDRAIKADLEPVVCN